MGRLLRMPECEPLRMARPNRIGHPDRGLAARIVGDSRPSTRPTLARGIFRSAGGQQHGFTSAKYLGRLDPRPSGLSPQAALCVNIGTTDDPRCGLWLFRRVEAQDRLILGLDLDNQVIRATFGSNGTTVAWGTANGTVSVCRIPEVQPRLAQMGLGWE